MLQRCGSSGERSLGLQAGQSTVSLIFSPELQGVFGAHPHTFQSKEFEVDRGGPRLKTCM